MVVLLAVVAGLLWLLVGLDAGRPDSRTVEDGAPTGPTRPELGTPAERAGVATEVRRTGALSAERGALSGPGNAAPLAPAPAGTGRTHAERTGVRGAAPAPPPDLVWTLRVTSDAEPRGVAGAKLELRGGGRRRSATTNAEGRCRIDWFSELETSLSLSHTEYLDLRDPEVDLERPGAYRLRRGAALEVELGGVAPTGPATVHLWHMRDARAWNWPERVAEAVDGRARFERLEPGEYALSADAPGAAAPYEQGLQLAAGEELVRQLVLVKPAGFLGRVVELVSGVPVVGAALRVEPGKDGLPVQLRRLRRLEVETDAAGAFALEGLAPGSYRLRIDLPWQGRESRDLEVVVSGARSELLVEVPGPMPLSGRVLDAAGDAASGARVVAVARHDRGRVAELIEDAGEAREPEDGRWVTADAAGAFHFEGLPSGEPLFLLAFARRGGSPARADVPALDGAQDGTRIGAPNVVLRLPPSSSLRGRVRGPDGKHLAGARVELFAPVGGKRVAWRATRTGADGRYLLEGLPEGALTLEANLRGYLTALEPLELSGEVSGDGSRELDIVLRPAMELRGVVVDLEGQALPNIRVRVRPDPDALDAEARADKLGKLKFIGWSNLDGEFRIQNLRRLDWVAEIDANDWELARTTPRVLGPGDGEVWTLTLAASRRAARATLRAFVVRAGDGGPPLGLNVRGLRGAAFEQDGGELRITGVAPGAQRLTLEATGCVPLPLPAFELVPGEDRDLGRIELVQGTRLTISVRDLAGKPLNGAKVRLRSLPTAAGGLGTGAWVPRPKALGGGRYRWEALPRAAYTLVVRKAGFRTSRAPLRVREKEGQKRGVTLTAKGG